MVASDRLSLLRLNGKISQQDIRFTNAGIVVVWALKTMLNRCLNASLIMQLVDVIVVGRGSLVVWTVILVY